jgi:hypothetical protein
MATAPGRPGGQARSGSGVGTAPDRHHAAHQGRARRPGPASRGRPIRRIKGQPGRLGLEALTGKIRVLIGQPHQRPHPGDGRTAPVDHPRRHGFDRLDGGELGLVAGRILLWQTRLQLGPGQAAGPLVGVTGRPTGQLHAGLVQRLLVQLPVQLGIGASQPRHGATTSHLANRMRVNRHRPARGHRASPRHPELAASGRWRTRSCRLALPPTTAARQTSPHRLRWTAYTSGSEARGPGSCCLQWRSDVTTKRFRFRRWSWARPVGPTSGADS